MEICDEDDENVTIELYLLTMRGRRQIPLALLLPITAVYLVIFSLGLIGNIAVCIVIIKHAHMRTTTNFHLFSLALSDLIMLLFGLPNDLGVYWQQYPWEYGIAMCKLRALISEMTSYTSVLTIVCFSGERYLAVVRPLDSLGKLGARRRALSLIAASWLTALAAASPFAIFTTVHYVSFPNSNCLLKSSAFCSLHDDNLPIPIYELSTLLFFVVPLYAIIFIYVRIAIVLKRRKTKKRKEDNSSGGTELLRKTASSGEKIDRMLIAVVVGFFICWAPFHAQRLLYLYGRDLEDYQLINEWMYYITGIFYYVSSTINPILYNVMSVKYRKAFKETLLWKTKRMQNSVTTKSTSVMLNDRS